MRVRGVALATLFAALVGWSGSVEASALVRVAHLSPDAPNVDVWVDGNVVLSDVPFGAISDRLPLPPGTYTVQVTPAGATEPVVIDADLTLDSGVSYTVAATGVLADIAPLVLVDDTVTDPDFAKVRFNHTSPDAPAVDVAVAGGPVLFSNVSFGESSGYLNVDPGTYDLEVRVAGTSTVALSLPGVALAGETNYEVFAIGLLADMTLGALTALTATPEPAEVRVAHLSPDAPNVDVWVDGSVVLADVPFLTVSDYLTLAPGSYLVQVTPAGQTAPIVIDETLTLSSGTSYTVAATGLLGAGDLQPQVLVDDRDPSADQAKVRFVHDSPDAPAVDVAVAGGPVLFADFEFRESSAYLPVDPGTYDLEVRLAGTTTVVLELPGVALAAGINATAFAVGLVGDMTLNALIAIDVNEVFVRGDSDRNGTFQVSDPVATIERLFNGATLEGYCADAADANDDGHVDIADVVYSLEYLFIGGPAPTAPFPSAGTDPTADELRCDR
ncbi:MAG: DUF4397 domain-containing protein [Planctomycetota bacterium]